MTNQTPGRPHVRKETVEDIRRISGKMDFYSSQDTVLTLLAYIEQLEERLAAENTGSLMLKLEALFDADDTTNAGFSVSYRDLGWTVWRRAITQSNYGPVELETILVEDCDLDSALAWAIEKIQKGETG